MTFQFLQIVLILKINGLTLLLEASTFLSTMNLSTMTKTADYSLFSFITNSSGTKPLLWRRIKNLECHFKILGKVVEVENEANIEKETL